MAAPPSYSQAQLSASSGDPAQLTPDYSKIYKFPIGGKNTVPFVTVDQLKAHLSLLHSFHGLRFKAEATEFSQVPLTPRESLETRRWSFFVSYAVERFQAWCCSSQLITINEGDVHLPPLDVLMIWHAFRLNPAWYAEDSVRVLGLFRLEQRAGSTFRYLFTPDAPTSPAHQRCQERLLEEATYDRHGEPPSEDRADQWTMLTNLPFDAFDGITSWNERALSCPYCYSLIGAKLLTSDGTGYLQSAFSVQCAGCDKAFNRNTLAVDKFTKNYTSTSDTCSSLLAGTLHTVFSPVDKPKAALLKQSIGQSSVFARPEGASTAEWQHHISGICKWDPGLLFIFVGQRMEFQGGKVLARMRTAYIDDRPFSVDLVGATLRQASFVEKMEKLGWSNPSCFKSAEDEIVLLRAIARYHTFLDLLSSKPGSVLTPTLDIDLVWHTHQLFSSQYGQDTRKYVGRFIDHDDKVADIALLDAFNATCKEWEKRFGVKYCLCGCGPPTKSIGDKMSKRVSKVLGGKKTTPNDHLLPFNWLELSAATHPSDHNSVANGNPTKPDRKEVPDPFWDKPFVHPVIVFEPADCVAAAGMIHSEYAAGSGLSSSQSLQSAYMGFDSVMFGLSRGGGL